MRLTFIDPGRFRTEFALQAVALVPDSAGGHAQNWSTVASVLAAIEPVTAKNRFVADQTLETVTHRVTMRFRADLASGMRLVRGTRVFAILTAHDPDETGRYLVAMVAEQGR